MENDNRIENFETIELIKELIESEKKSLTFYNLLLNQINDDDDTYIIRKIMNNQIKHINILKELIFDITNTHINDIRSIYIENRCNDNYLKNLKNVLFDEMEIMKKYGMALNLMPDTHKYNMIMEILIDKICHLNMFNFLISQNICNRVEDNS